MHDPKKPAQPSESSREPTKGGFRAVAGFVIADGLPQQRLYARFDAIARGRAPGDSSAVHQSVIESTLASSAARELPYDIEGRVGTDLTNLSWRSRMRWLDDGGR